MKATNSNEIRFVDYADAKYAPEICQLLNDVYRTGEPVANHLKLTTEEISPIFRDSYDQPRPRLDAFAIVALTNDDKVAGYSFAKKMKKPPQAVKHPESVSPNLAKYLSVYGDRVFQNECLSEADVIARLKLLVIHPEYSGRGIATKLLELSLHKAQEMGCDYLVTGSSRPATAHIMEKKLGFKCASQLQLPVFSVDGEHPFADIPEEFSVTKVLYKDLRQ